MHVFEVGCEGSDLILHNRPQLFVLGRRADTYLFWMWALWRRQWVHIETEAFCETQTQKLEHKMQQGVKVPPPLEANFPLKHMENSLKCQHSGTLWLFLCWITAEWLQCWLTDVYLFASGRPVLAQVASHWNFHLNRHMWFIFMHPFISWGLQHPSPVHCRMHTHSPFALTHT